MKTLLLILAVLPYAPDTTLVDYLVVPIEMSATRDVLRREEVTEGDEIFFAGLLPQYHGTTRNYPVIRFGRLALLTDEPYVTQSGQEYLYFAECNSFPGQSGSPVFLRFSPIRRPYVRLAETRMFLLGVMKGHFQEPLGDRLANVGIAAVIPVDKLQDIFNSPTLVLLRESVIKNVQQKTEGHTS